MCPTVAEMGVAVKLGFFNFWNFAAISQPFRSCEMRVTVLRNGTRVPKLVLQLRNTLLSGVLAAKFFIFYFGFAAIFAAAK